MYITTWMITDAPSLPVYREELVRSSVKNDRYYYCFDLGWNSILCKQTVGYSHMYEGTKDSSLVIVS